MLMQVKELKLIYRGTEDGFGANDFHKKCDYKGETLVIINAENKKGN